MPRISLHGRKECSQFKCKFLPSKQRISFPQGRLQGLNRVALSLGNVAGGCQTNRPPATFDATRDLPQGFLEFLAPLHRRFAPWQRSLIAERKEILAESHQGEKPVHRFPGDAVRRGWRIQLPEWCRDQRNQMTGPADDADLVVKMLNSGAPGVMLDLEDSMVNEWEHQRLGVENILQALRGTLTYFDKKRNQVVGIEPRPTVIWTRPRGLHIQQGGIFGEELTPASLFDVASIVYQADPGEMKHRLAFYIPKSESAEKALWWRDLFLTLCEQRGWRAITSSVWRWWSRIRWLFRWRSFFTTTRPHSGG